MSNLFSFPPSILNLFFKLFVISKSLVQVSSPLVDPLLFFLRVVSLVFWLHLFSFKSEREDVSKLVNVHLPLHALVEKNERIHHENNLGITEVDPITSARVVFQKGLR
jgi:hypothetical protein